MKNTKLLIGGDFVITEETNYSIENLDENLFQLFKNSDINILNLEAPITDSNTKIIKTGPHLKANKVSSLETLKEIEVDIVTLANNHILDYGEQGLRETLDFCDKNNFRTVGAQCDLKRALETLFIDTANERIAIVNFAENEWASASEETAGANPMNLIDNINQIKDAKQKADFVFVIIHGGHEYYNLPSPRIQKQYRFYAEQGADIVIAHHSHCISGHEIHNQVPIYYSLGNFLFTKPNKHNDWYQGLVLEIEIKDNKLSTSLHPVEQTRENFSLSLLKGNKKQEVFNRISSLNEVIQDEFKLIEEWNKYIQLKYNIYLNHLSPVSFVKSNLLKALFNKLGIKMINKQGIAMLLNIMRCEAHSDLTKEVAQKYLSK